MATENFYELLCIEGVNFQTGRKKEVVKSLIVLLNRAKKKIF